MSLLQRPKYVEFRSNGVLSCTCTNSGHLSPHLIFQYHRHEMDLLNSITTYAPTPSVIPNVFLVTQLECPTTYFFSGLVDNSEISPSVSQCLSQSQLKSPSMALLE